MSRPPVSGIKINGWAGPAEHFNNNPTTNPHHSAPCSEIRLRNKFQLYPNFIFPAFLPAGVIQPVAFRSVPDRYGESKNTSRAESLNVVRYWVN